MSRPFAQDSVVAAYDTADHTDQAIDALRRAGVPDSSIHRHIRDGDEMTREHPAIVETDEGSIWSTLFGTEHSVELLIHDGSPAAGGTVVRVTRIPPQHYQAVIDILQRFHPAELQVAPGM